MMPRRAGEAVRRTEREIAGEKAATLGRAGERLEAALREVAVVRARVMTANGRQECERLAKEHERARQAALVARRTLLIQREALGLRHHRVVDQLYPEPPRLSR
ncbi:MAG: hypothetical protein ACRELS_01170 [Candidatus Rokuibacteriota bacterium]